MVLGRLQLLVTQIGLTTQKNKQQTNFKIVWKFPRGIPHMENSKRVWNANVCKRSINQYHACSSVARLFGSGGARNKKGETQSRGFGGRSPPTLEKFWNFTINFQVKIWYFEVMIFCLLADYKAIFWEKFNKIHRGSPPNQPKF